MTYQPFVPFGTDDDQLAALHVLQEGVPAQLLEPLLAWIRPHIAADRGGIKESAVLALQSALSLDLGVSASAGPQLNFVLDKIRNLESIQQLRVADFLLSELSNSLAKYYVDELNGVLDRARSYVTTAKQNGAWRLVRREAEGVQLSVEETVAASADAGRQLAKAWSYLHQLEPQASEAMLWAVRAVETAAIPVVSPNNGRATLGTVLRDLRAQGSWSLPLRRTSGQPDHHAMLIEMISTLWTGHEDRHGGLNPDPVTFEQAQTSVYLAATLVAWFAKGSVRKI